jgi:hypothetical protein
MSITINGSGDINATGNDIDQLLAFIIGAL